MSTPAATQATPSFSEAARQFASTGATATKDVLSYAFERGAAFLSGATSSGKEYAYIAWGYTKSFGSASFSKGASIWVAGKDLFFVIFGSLRDNAIKGTAATAAFAAPHFKTSLEFAKQNNRALGVGLALGIAGCYLYGRISNLRASATLKTDPNPVVPPAIDLGQMQRDLKAAQDEIRILKGDVDALKQQAGKVDAIADALKALTDNITRQSTTVDKLVDLQKVHSRFSIMVKSPEELIGGVVVKDPNYMTTDMEEGQPILETQPKSELNVVQTLSPKKPVLPPKPHATKKEADDKPEEHEVNLVNKKTDAPVPVAPTESPVETTVSNSTDSTPIKTDDTEIKASGDVPQPDVNTTTDTAVSSVNTSLN